MNRGGLQSHWLAGGQAQSGISGGSGDELACQMLCFAFGGFCGMCQHVPSSQFPKIGLTFHSRVDASVLGPVVPFFAQGTPSSRRGNGGRSDFGHKQRAVFSDDQESTAITTVPLCSL